MTGQESSAPEVRLGRLVADLTQGVSPVCAQRPADLSEWGVLKLSAVANGEFKPEANKALIDGTGSRNMSVARGDILITRSNTPDLVGDGCLVREEPGRVLLPDLIYRLRLRPDSFDARYLMYVLISSSVQAKLRASARGTSHSMVKIRGNDIRHLEVPRPPLEYQTAVADLLDRETGRIDELASKKERLVKLLLLRRVQVRRATFGEGRPDERLPWLPQLPKKWPVLPLRWIVECLDGQRIPLNSEDRSEVPGDYPYWGANGVVDHIGEFLFDEELVLLGEDGAPFFESTRDVAFRIEGKVWINNHIHVLRPTSVRAAYLAHYLNLVDYGAFISGTTRDKLTQSDMGEIPVPVPPFAEQQRIERAISVALSTTDTLLRKLRRQIELLYERRQALITAAVTGQLDVGGHVGSAS